MNIEMKKIKFAVIGLGHIGKRHAEMIKRNPDAELVAVCDILLKIYNIVIVLFIHK